MSTHAPAGHTECGGAGAETAGAPAAPGDTAMPPRVMLLSVWAVSGQSWHARLVAPDAAVHDFCSPFELARFLAQPPPPRPGGCGLR